MTFIFSFGHPFSPMFKLVKKERKVKFCWTKNNPKNSTPTEGLFSFNVFLFRFGSVWPKKFLFYNPLKLDMFFGSKSCFLGCVWDIVDTVGWQNVIFISWVFSKNYTLEGFTNIYKRVHNRQRHSFLGAEGRQPPSTRVFTREKSLLYRGKISGEVFKIHTSSVSYPHTGKKRTYDHACECSHARSLVCARVLIKCRWCFCRSFVTWGSKSVESTFFSYFTLHVQSGNLRPRRKNSTNRG